MIEVLRRVASGQELPLPEWEDFGGKFMKACWRFIGYVIYSIPLIVLYVIVAIITAIVGGVSGSDSDSAGASSACAGWPCRVWRSSTASSSTDC